MASQISLQEEMQDPIRSEAEEHVLFSSYILRARGGRRTLFLVGEVQTGPSIEQRAARIQ
jgi:hypothetical protein